MTQTRLERFWGDTQPVTRPSLNYFDLPQNARSCVYEHLGLDLGRIIYLNVSNHGEDFVYPPLRIKKWDHPKKACCGHQPPLILVSCLLVSRRFYQEIIPILYSSNIFRISRRAEGGLRALFNLSHLTLVSLRSLTIALHECWSLCRRLRHETCGYNGAEDPEMEHNPPQGPLSQSGDGLIIYEWAKICKHLATSLQPSRLQLCLICDVADYETAQNIISPLQYLPPLRACSIRFSTTYNPRLRSLAESTTLKLTGQARHQGAPLMCPCLPYELQARILGHTDLIAPRELEWVPDFGYLCRHNSSCEWDWFPQTTTDSTNPCQTCIAVNYFCYEEMKGRHSSSGSICQCWRFPKSMFLLNRELRRDALRIFYSRNIFVILPSNVDWDCRQPDTVSTIMQVPREAIRHLRYIQFVVPDSAIYLRELKSLQILKNYADLASLTLAIDLTRNRHWFDDHGGDHHWVMDENRWRRDKCVVEPLEQLSGLKDLFIHLAYPELDDEGLPARELRERTLEQSIMGTGYESMARGKPLRPLATLEDD